MSTERQKTENVKGESAQRPWFVHIEDVLGTFALGVILIVMATQIVLRYVFNGSLIWSEEISRYLLIALVFMGTATAVREREHIQIDLIDRLIPPQALSVLKIMVDITLAIYLCVIVYHAQTVVVMFRNQPSSALQIPMAIPYAAVPLGFGLALWRLAGLYVNRRKGARDDTITRCFAVDVVVEGSRICCSGHSITRILPGSGPAGRCDRAAAV